MNCLEVKPLTKEHSFMYPQKVIVKISKEAINDIKKNHTKT